MAGLSTRHLLGIKYITPDDINLIFETADTFKEVLNRPIKKVPSLRDITIANLFLKIRLELECPLNWLKNALPLMWLTFQLPLLPSKKEKPYSIPLIISFR